MSSPKDVLTLLQILDLSSKSPAYAHITSAAHDALVNVQLVVLKANENKEEDNEEKSSRPTHAPSVRR